MNLSGNHADIDKEVDLTDIRIFKQQYEANFRRLKYFGMQYIPDEEVVADLIQDVWLRIWERQEVFPNLVAFRAYLSQSLYHAILNHLKHARVETEYAGQAVSREPQEEEVTIRMIKAEVYQMVNAASLSGKTQREIAEEFHITINTVKKHINNANHQLRRRLKDALLAVCHLLARPA